VHEPAAQLEPPDCSDAQAQPMTTRDDLIQEGLRAFSSSGFEGASLREIERGAGLSRGLVAHHFGTKDELWRECVNWLMGRFHDEMDEQRRNLADVSPHERAKVLLKVYVRFAARHPEYTKMLMLAGNDDSERVRWMVDTWIRPNQSFFNRMTNQTEEGASHLEALSVYAFMGAASMLFTFPVEARAVCGLDTTSPLVIEEFADLIVNWVGYREDADGRIDSELGRAAKAASQKHSVKLD
jgi:TetR/AcrR family transcriptional regulator